jgi:hypothetical protein
MNILIFLICFFIVLLYLIYKFTTKKKKEPYSIPSDTTSEVFGIDFGDFYTYYNFTSIDSNGILSFGDQPLTVDRLNLLLPEGYKIATLSDLQDATFKGGMQHYTWGICQGATDNFIRGVCPLQSPLLTTVNNPYASRLVTITSISVGSTITPGYQYPTVLWIYGVKPSTNEGIKSIPLKSSPTQDNGAGITLKTDYSNSFGRKIYNWYNPLPGETKVPSAWSFKDGVGPLTSDSCMYPLQTTINNEIYYLNYDSDSGSPTLSLSKSLISMTPWIYNSNNTILIFEDNNGNFDVLMCPIGFAFSNLLTVVTPLEENTSNINDLLPPKKADDGVYVSYKINFNSDGTIVFVDNDSNGTKYGITYINLKQGNGLPFTGLTVTKDPTEWLKFKQIKWSDMINSSQTPVLPPLLPQLQGTTGQICVTAQYGTTLTANAPYGASFTRLLFADYGNPTQCPSNNLQSNDCSAYLCRAEAPDGSYHGGDYYDNCNSYNNIINTTTFNGTTIKGSKTVSVLVTDETLGLSGGTHPFDCIFSKSFTVLLEYAYPGQAPTPAPPTPAPPTPAPPTPTPRPLPNTKGEICVTAQYGTTFTANSPEGTHFTRLLFADYGNPTQCPSNNPQTGDTCSAYDCRAEAPDRSYHWGDYYDNCNSYNNIINTTTFNGTTIQGSKTLSVLVTDETLGFGVGTTPAFDCIVAKSFTVLLEYVWE